MIHLFPCFVLGIHSIAYLHNDGFNSKQMKRNLNVFSRNTERVEAISFYPEKKIW